MLTSFSLASAPISTSAASSPPRQHVDHQIAVGDHTLDVHAQRGHLGDDQRTDVMLAHQPRRFDERTVGVHGHDAAAADGSDGHGNLLRTAWVIVHDSLSRGLTQLKRGIPPRVQPPG
jgi:hypothetical protein